MGKQNEPSGKPNFFSEALTKYGRYLYMPGEPIPGYVVTCQQTITVVERIPLPEAQTEATCYKRIEPARPIDFLEYYGRKN